MTANPLRRRTTVFAVAWPHDGAKRLDFMVDGDLSMDLGERIRRSVGVASSHGGLRLVLENILSDRYLVTIEPTVEEVTAVRLTLPERSS